jgi:hypothetical protein
MGLTTPSSTQPSSPSASPALSATDDRKRNKSESEDNQSQRNRYSIKKESLSFPSNIFLDQILVRMVHQRPVCLMAPHRKIPCYINNHLMYHLQIKLHYHQHQQHFQQVHHHILLIQQQLQQLSLFYNIQQLFHKILYHQHRQQQ